MSHPDPHPPLPPRRRGAHRTGRSLTAALVPSLLAVVAVAALITSLAVWRGEDPTQPTAAAATSAASRAALSAASGRPAGTPAPSPVTTVPSGTPTPSTATASGGRTHNGSGAGGTSEKPAVRDVQVVVLNQTTRVGLAGSVAQVLRADGWTVPAVGNFRGTVPATTVYYPPGDEAAALAAAGSLPTAPRTRLTFGNLSTSRLTVVVTDSYPG
jgi:hypothetical protein